ncbi:Acetyltransferase (GNAT) family protein [Salinibacterium xinjiangense]|uniref:Acetyltransferase (GNAT) family protein n=1 Tax=Salinibacterium xinjiangense TaxID=386302 RepID=A0A2C8ZYB1_9MICO|nr:GNAT family N-acetyltransferase [Salinibacterium xinjiangense]SOE70988.1 Acetyltransferase (GNAT) family protein [Salinibacterium xinjiangense]
MTTFTIDEVTIPSGIADPGAVDFIEAIDLGNAVNALGYGTTDINYEPAEELPHFLNPHEPMTLLVARVDGRMAGRGIYETQTGEDADSAWLAAQVLPEFRGLGIGTALAEAVETMAASAGKSKALVYTPIPPMSGEQLTPPTGFGSVVRDHAATRFLLRRGYRLEQVERASRLGLPVDGLATRLADAEQSSGVDYVLRYWEGRTPERWLEGFAHLATRMSTDAPSAGLEEPEDVWTVERVIEFDDRNARLNPRRRVVAADEHLRSGSLVGFTVLSVPQQLVRAVDQYATLVLREHRGHRLGMLLKVANLEHLERVAPGHPSVITFNAEENRHMLDVNEAVGFVPIASESAWRKDLV